jgi:hypothetical protein
MIRMRDQDGLSPVAIETEPCTAAAALGRELEAEHGP